MERLYRPPLPASETHSLAEPLAKIPILRGAAKREGPDTAVRKSRSAQSEGGEGENLIFLISQPRAGSTMLQKVLGSHPEIHTVSEPWVALPPSSPYEKKASPPTTMLLWHARLSPGFSGPCPRERMRTGKPCGGCSITYTGAPSRKLESAYFSTRRLATIL